MNYPLIISCIPTKMVDETRVCWDKSSWSQEGDLTFQLLRDVRLEDPKHDRWTGTPVPPSQVVAAFNDQKCSQLMFYIHGFNNRPANPISIAASLNDIFAGFDASTLPVNFGQLLTVPVMWPCADDFVFERYRHDLRTSELVGPAFAEWLRNVGIAPLDSTFDSTDQPASSTSTSSSSSSTETMPVLTSRLHLCCHSMGNRILRNTPILSTIFQHIFMIAPDIDNDLFTTPVGDSILKLATSSVFVIYNNSDVALIASEKLPGRPNYVPLGHRPIEPENLSSIPLCFVDALGHFPLSPPQGVHGEHSYQAFPPLWQLLCQKHSLFSDPYNIPSEWRCTIL